MEVILKHKIYSLLLILFILCASSTIVVSADTDNTVSINKTVKVNKKIKLRKTLKLNKTEIKNYTFTSSKTNVASVSSKGVVTGLKKGTATITVTSKADNSVYATISVKVKNRYTKKNLRLMASIIYSEAGNQSFSGKKAVGIVVMNRVRSTSFPNSLSGVIYQPGQFSPARNGSLNDSLALFDAGKLDKQCIKAAKAVLNGDTFVSIKQKSVNMKNYLFFSGYVSGCRLQIGSHQFK